MAICTICVNSISQLHPGATPRQLSSGIYPPHSTSSAETCWICSRFSQWAQSDQDRPVFDRWQREPLEIRFFLFDCQYARDKNNRVDPISLSISLLPPDTRFSDGCFIDVFFLSPEDYLRYLEPSGMATMPSTSNADNIESLERWISNCTQNHRRCQNQSRGKWFPTRLLYISNAGQSARLILTKDTPPLHPYITLSHRWGDLEYDKLTSSNIQDFQTSVDVGRLPKVFQDAIALSWSLGIHYLWIDSLCIKQDPDLSDWETEALLMQKVYSNSMLNISASRLGKEKEDKPLNCPQPWDVSRPTHVIMEIEKQKKPYWLIDGNIWEDEVEDTPLMQRAWVFQERFLAPRVLHFGKRQLAWECNELTALEMFPKGLPSFLLPQSKSNILSTLTGDESRGDNASRNFREAWRFLVGQYSRCELTYGKDKLIAFSGVAKMLEAYTGNEYIAGTWKNTLIYDLGWYRSGCDSEDFPSASTAYRAPSWSWMSVEGEIFLPSALDDVAEHFATILSYPPSEDVGSSALRAKGQIELECIPLKITSIKWKGDTITEFEVAGISIVDDIAESGSQLNLEGSEGEIKSLTHQGIFMVPLFSTNLAVFSVVVSEGGSGSYKRVGAAKIEYGRKFDTQQESIPDGWTTNGSSSFIVHETRSYLFTQLAEAQKIPRALIKVD
ncbi:HET-domain-containing protein [Colletotrichum eremochloae]|nr:HET-domain-containing protein [Colletotrichum eremochloae]